MKGSLTAIVVIFVVVIGLLIFNNMQNNGQTLFCSVGVPNAVCTTPTPTPVP